MELQIVTRSTLLSHNAAKRMREHLHLLARSPTQMAMATETCFASATVRLGCCVSVMRMEEATCSMTATKMVT